MATLDEPIAAHLRASEASGELRAAPSHGWVLALADGYQRTLDLRLPRAPAAPPRPAPPPG